MARQLAEPTTTTKTRHAVTVYLFLAVGVIVGTIALVAYLFTGQ